MIKIIEHIVNAIGVVIIVPILAIIITVDMLVNQNKNDGK